MTSSATLFYAVVGGALGLCVVVLVGRLITRGLCCFVSRYCSLRDMCRAEYGNEFVESVYDEINAGRPVGDLEQTMAYLDMIERVREQREQIIKMATARRRKR